MPRDNESQALLQNESNNMNVTNIARVGASTVLSAIGTGNYYAQTLSQPILGAINAALYIPQLGINIWNLNHAPTLKNRLLNSVKKVLVGLGIITIANYQEWINQISNNPLIPTTTQIPITTSVSTTTETSTTLNPSTTTKDPWGLTQQLTNNPVETSLNTYIALNAYGASQVISGITDLLPIKFNKVKKVTNTLSGASLATVGITIGLEHGFDNTTAPVTLAAGITETISALLPVQEASETLEMETLFANQASVSINDSPNLSWDGFQEVDLHSETSSQFGL